MTKETRDAHALHDFLWRGDPNATNDASESIISWRAVYDRDARLSERGDLMQFWADKIAALRDDQSSKQLAVADWRA